MAEREPPRLVRRPDDVGGDHGVQRVQRLILTHARRRRGDREVERVAGDRRAPHEVPRANREHGNLRRERRDDGPGDAWSAGPRRHARRRRPSTRQRLQVEGVAAALTEEHGPRRPTDLRPQQGVDRCARKPFEHDDVALPTLCGSVQRALERGCASRAGRQDEQDSASRQAVQQQRHHLGRRGVRPVHIVQQHHQGTALTEMLEQRPHRPRRAMPLTRNGGRHPRQARHRRHHHGQLGQLLAPDVGQDLRRVGHHIVERVDPEREGDVPFQLGRPPGHDDMPARARPPPDLVQQPRLADPRLARDPYRPRAPGARLVQRPLEHRELGFTADQRRQARAHHDATVPPTAPRRTAGIQVDVRLLPSRSSRGASFS